MRQERIERHSGWHPFVGCVGLSHLNLWSISLPLRPIISTHLCTRLPPSLPPWLLGHRSHLQSGVCVAEECNQKQRCGQWCVCVCACVCVCVRERQSRLWERITMAVLRHSDWHHIQTQRGRIERKENWESHKGDEGCGEKKRDREGLEQRKPLRWQHVNTPTAGL